MLHFWASIVARFQQPLTIRQSQHASARFPRWLASRDGAQRHLHLPQPSLVRESKEHSHAADKNTYAPRSMRIALQPERSATTSPCPQHTGTSHRNHRRGARSPSEESRMQAELRTLPESETRENPSHQSQMVRGCQLFARSQTRIVQIQNAQYPLGFSLVHPTWTQRACDPSNHPHLTAPPCRKLRT